jgi:hypothetical protein
MPLWRADLHVHTTLSGCAEAEMIPPLLIARCQEQGLAIVGVLDHNSAGNCQAVIEAAEGSGVTVKPGLEVESRETVHLVCLFDVIEQALDLQQVVYEHLARFPSAGAARSFGMQMLLSKEGELVGYEDHALFAATDLPAAAVVEEARGRGGMVVGAHVERRAHGLLGVLGFVPEGLDLDGLEAGPRGLTDGRMASSDAHRLAEIGSRYTVFEAETAAIADLRECLRVGRFRAGMAL